MFSKGKVLIVDDEEIVCKSLSIILEEQGFDADSALTAQEGLKLIQDNNYDTVLLDLKIPGSDDGISLLKKVKEIDPSCVVIIITGYPSDETIEDALKNGAFDYIVKPFEVERINSIVEKAVARRKNLLSEGQ